MSDDKKDPKAGDSEYIHLNVWGDHDGILRVKMKKNTPLRKLMISYFYKVGPVEAPRRFLFDGEPINYANTPLGLEMEDGDVIEVFRPQTGGLACPVSQSFIES